MRLLLVVLNRLLWITLRVPIDWTTSLMLTTAVSVRKLRSEGPMVDALGAKIETIGQNAKSAGNRTVYKCDLLQHDKYV